MSGFKLTGLAAGTAATDAARVGQLQAQTGVTLTGVSGTNTITAAGSPAVTAYSAGQFFRLTAANTNTGATTLNIDSLGAKNIYKNGAALSGGEIISGKIYGVLYDGTQFNIMEDSAFGPGGIQAQTYTAFTTGGTSTAYTLTPSPTLAAYAENQEFDVEFHTASGATPTLNVSAIGTKNLKYRDSTGTLQAITSTQVPTGWRSRVTYDGTDMVVREVAGLPIGLASSAEVIAGTNTEKAVTPSSLRSGAVVSGTAVASTSGTSIDFTAIPSWVKQIVVMFAGVSTSGTSVPIIQIGDSGGVETSGYLGSGSQVVGGATASANFTTGVPVVATTTAANVLHGAVILTLLDAATNTWVAAGATSASNIAANFTVSSSKSLSATLDSVRITTVGGTDTFDAGMLNVMYN